MFCFLFLSLRVLLWFIGYFVHCVGDLLEGFLGAWMTVFVGVQLLGNRAVIAPHILLLTRGKPIYERLQGRLQELVDQEHLLKREGSCSLQAK